MLTDEEVEIEKEFNDIIENKLTPSQFVDWYQQWIDPMIIIEIAEEWDTEVKRENLPDLREIIKNNK